MQLKLQEIYKCSGFLCKELYPYGGLICWCENNLHWIINLKYPRFEILSNSTNFQISENIADRKIYYVLSESQQLYIRNNILKTVQIILFAMFLTEISSKNFNVHMHVTFNLFTKTACCACKYC